MTTVKDMCSIMESFAPVSLAMDWDNVGLMLGKSNREIKKVLLALDLTEEVVEQAVKNEVQMVITHHPAIFRKLSRVTDQDWQQKLLLTLAESKIAVYSAHTNFDCAIEGVNHVLANRLELNDAAILDAACGLGRMGYVESSSLLEFANKVKCILDADYITYADCGKKVSFVGVCGGAGSDLVDLCIAKGIDTLVTGDVKYHTAQDAVFKGLNIIDAGHQATERIAIQFLFDRLNEYCKDNCIDVEFVLAEESLILKHI